MTCSGGLYSQQHFTWENLNNISSLDTTKLFLDNQNVTVTLSVDLQASGDPALAYGTPGSTIPNGSLAVNLGSKGFQFNTSNMLNGDEWGKLVYYEQGGLGIGWAFSANSYFTRQGINIPNGLGMYMTGGLLPDVDFQTMGAGTNFNYMNSIPMYNLQIGRDQALLTQMVMTGEVDGPQGYWSVQPVNFDTSVGNGGRWGGIIDSGPAPSSGDPTIPFGSYGFMANAYPTSLGSTVGWNMLYPMYSPSTQDGYMPSGNALSIETASFFTKEGLELLTNVSSNPSDPAVPAKLWTDYWKNATSVIHLEETRPFYIESPMFNVPMSMALIPNFNNGLDMLVPITRICNGVYLYVPVKISNDKNINALNMVTTTVSDPCYFSTSVGTLQRWFKPLKVSLTINMPFISVETALQASRFFNTIALLRDYTTLCPVWIKYFFAPNYNPNGSITNPLNPDSTASLSQIAGASQGFGLEFTYTARQILNRVQEVLNSHQIPTPNGWGIGSLVISGIIVSCTTVLDVPRLYSNVFGLPAFQDSPQGSIMTKGGIKVFGRCGHSLSAGPPNNFYIDAVDVTDGGGLEDNMSNLHIEFSNSGDKSRGSKNNDYFSSARGFVFTNSLSIRVPEFTNTSDSGGSITIGFNPRPVLNMPFSGEVLNDGGVGGPQVGSGNIANGVLSSANLQAYKMGWFNNLNPYSPDFNTVYGNAGAAATRDNLAYLDYKLVDFTKRKVEIWLQVMVPVRIYNGTPFS